MCGGTPLNLTTICVPRSSGNRNACPTRPALYDVARSGIVTAVARVGASACAFHSWAEANTAAAITNANRTVRVSAGRLRSLPAIGRTTTWPRSIVRSRRVASRIGTTLVEEHLASCVNRLSRVVSTYWWGGKLHTDTEALLMIKTSERLLPQLTRRIEELHPAELPEVITLPITGGSERYLEWLGQNLAP